MNYETFKKWRKIKRTHGNFESAEGTRLIERCTGLKTMAEKFFVFNTIDDESLFNNFRFKAKEVTDGFYKDFICSFKDGSSFIWSYDFKRVLR